MNTPIKVKIIVGSTRQNRFSEKPARWIFEEVKKEEGVEAELLDLRDYEMPLFDEAMSPAMAKGQYSTEVVKKWAAKINDRDALLIIAPEYKPSYSVFITTRMDVIYPEWNRKPVGFVSYGSAMGARSVEQLRQVAVELQMAPIRNAVHIPNDIFFPAMMGNGPTGPEIFEPIRRSPMGDPVERFFNDLLWWARALKTAKEPQISSN